MKSWDEVRRWRVVRRKELTHFRRTVPLQKRRAARRSVVETLGQVLHRLPVSPRVVAGYWPIKGEIDLSELMKELISDGVTLVLPVVVKEASPVEFWRWVPNMKMDKGIWGIPVPAVEEAIVPDTILAPLVGFDTDCYRLGNGGGYYDRTLSELGSEAVVVGVGYGASKLETIFPQPHDIPMDIIVTEDGSFSRD